MNKTFQNIILEAGTLGIESPISFTAYPHKAILSKNVKIKTYFILYVEATIFNTQPFLSVLFDSLAYKTLLIDILTHKLLFLSRFTRCTFPNLLKIF